MLITTERLWKDTQWQTQDDWWQILNFGRTIYPQLSRFTHYFLMAHFHDGHLSQARFSQLPPIGNVEGIIQAKSSLRDTSRSESVILGSSNRPGGLNEGDLVTGTIWRKNPEGIMMRDNLFWGNKMVGSLSLKHLIMIRIVIWMTVLIEIIFPIPLWDHQWDNNSGCWIIIRFWMSG